MSAIAHTQSNKSFDFTLIAMFLGCLAILVAAVMYNVEQSKHNHPLNQTPPAPSAPKENAMSAAAIAAAIIPSDKNVDMSTTIPSIAANSALPSEIPQAMREAMEAKGITMEALKGDNPGIPAEMMTAMQKANPSAMSKGVTAMPKGTPKKAPQKDAVVVSSAVNHISNDGSPEEKQLVLASMQNIAIDPSDAKSMTVLAQIFLNHNELPASQIFAQRAMVTAPSDPEAPYLLGVVLTKNGDFRGASEQWNRSLNLEPSAKVQYALAMLYRYQFDNEAKAKEYLNLANKMPNVDESLKNHIIDELKK